MRRIETLEAVALNSPAGKAVGHLKTRFVVISGGQSGVDRAALDVALENYLPCRGWCPAGRWAEDGTIEAKYPLHETGSSDPAVRTELNVVDSDGTIVLSRGTPTDGTPLTESVALKHHRPLLLIDLDGEPPLIDFDEWVSANSIRELNIAGPRESFAPGEVYAKSHRILSALLIRQ